MIEFLQNCAWTKWFWTAYQHEDTGRTVILYFWKNPGRRYCKIDYTSYKRHNDS